MARKGKRKRREVQHFELDLEENLFQLSEALQQQSWQPAPYRQFRIYDRKPRQICAAPFADRVVHHALMDNLMPLFDSRLSNACFACRKGKGVHQAVRRYQRGARRYSYALKLDVSAYFPSIDHAILKRQLQQLVPDERILQLFNRIIDSAPSSPVRAWPGADLVDMMKIRNGLPIGNLTSQHLGNLYLAEVDDFIQADLKIPVYLRYVDDLILLHDSKPFLHEALEAIRERMAALHLSVHPHKVQLARVRDGLDVLGYRVWPYKVKLRNDNGYRMRRRLRRMAKDLRIPLVAASQSIAAWQGHCRHADSIALQKNILNAVVFVSGGASRFDPASVARRRLEQQTREFALREPHLERPGRRYQLRGISPCQDTVTLCTLCFGPLCCAGGAVTTLCRVNQSKQQLTARSRAD